MINVGFQLRLFNLLTNSQQTPGSHHGGYTGSGLAAWLVYTVHKSKGYSNIKNYSIYQTIVMYLNLPVLIS